MSLKLLAVGDVHLGRRPGGLPEGWRGRERAEQLGPRAAWRATVRAARKESVDAVLLLGDVVDDERRYLEAWSELESGLRELAGAGVEVVSVAGNHDVLVLPKLAEAVRGLRLLGRGGTWEEHLIERPGRGGVRLVGWSYPEAHARRDPTAEATLDALLGERRGLPTIGLLHGDLDAPSSPYAHFRSARLRATRCEAWLLGHVHAPSFTRDAGGGTALGYLGSLTGLDPTETGVHGPWLLEVAQGRLASARQLPLAPLRWERLEVEAGEVAHAEELQPAIAREIAALEERERESLGEARAIGLRVRLVGSHPRHRELRDALGELALDELRARLGGRELFVESVADEARPAVELAELARAEDPPGLLARRLLALDAGGDERERRRLLREARARARGLAESRAFLRLPPDARQPSDGELCDALVRAGLLALEELLRQRGAEGEGA